MGKLNCWEFMRCRREPGGEMVGELGVCPAALERETDGLNGGAWAGRICWGVSGTFCGGEIQGTVERKVVTCRLCDFYRTVRDEEGASFFARVPGCGVRVGAPR